MPRGDSGEGRLDMKTLAVELRSATAATQQLLDRVQDLQMSVTALKTRAESTATEIQALNKLLVTGENGAQSVVTRLAVIDSSIEELRRDVSKLEDAKTATRTAEISGKWQMWAALATGAIALIAAILAYFKKGP